MAYTPHPLSSIACIACIACIAYLIVENAINLAKLTSDSDTSVSPYCAEFRLKDHLLLLAKWLGSFDLADFPPLLADILTRRGIPLTFLTNSITQNNKEKLACPKPQN